MKGERQKMWTILSKEFLQIAKKKSFIISTILTPVLMAAFFVIPALLTEAARGEKVFHIVDLSGTYGPALMDALAQDPGKPAGLTFEAVSPDGETVDSLLGRYRPLILAKKVAGLLVWPREAEQNGSLFFYGVNIADMTSLRFMEKHVQRTFTRTHLLAADLNEGLIEAATRAPSLQTFKVKEEGVTQSDSKAELLMSIFMLTMLMSVIMAYGQLIMRGIIEEKNSRIVELLISSTTSKAVFFGKIFGIGLVGLTQVMAWIALTVAYLFWSPWGVPANYLAFLTPALALWFVVFFILGYFSFSILFALVGAAVNTDEEAQHFSAPISYMLFIPFLLGITMVTQNADSPLVVVASLVPFLSPMLMFMRISMVMPPLWQILVAVASSAVSIWLLIRIGARVFRVGILMYGKKPTLKEILNWIRVR
jgi:ABC-2 type transport system permease protein